MFHLSLILFPSSFPVEEGSNATSIGQGGTPENAVRPQAIGSINW